MHKRMFRLKRTKLALERRRQRLLKRWREKSANLEMMSTNLTNQKGKTRTVEEKKLVLLLVKATLKREIGNSQFKKSLDLYWTKIDVQVPRDLHMKQEDVTSLRKEFLSTGDISNHDDEKKRGWKSQIEYKNQCRHVEAYCFSH